MSTNIINRIQKTILVNKYIKQLYILFNLYIKHIIHKENICNISLYMLAINGVHFKWCDICIVPRTVIKIATFTNFAILIAYVIF